MYMTLRINRIQRFCLHDGPGIRSVLFLQGCHLRCPWCHNPETWPSGGGTPAAVAAVTAELLRERPWWQASGGGVTISGGEVLDQAAALAVLLDALGAAAVHRALESSGDGAATAVERLAPRTDLWLFDLKHADAQRLRQRTRARLPVVLANLDRLLADGARVVARIPLISGWNDDDAALHGLAGLCAARPRLAGIEVLPGHDHDKGARAVRAAVPPDRLVAAVAILAATALPTRIVR